MNKPTSIVETQADCDSQAPIFARLEQLNAIGAALSSERNIDSLLEKILLAAKDITHADGGTLYLVNEAQNGLHFAIMRNDSLNIALGGASGKPVEAPDLPFINAQGAPNNAMVAVYAALHDETVNIEDAYSAEGFDFSGTRHYDEHTGYRSRSFLTVPMKNHEHTVIGVLQLINAQTPESGVIRSFSSADQRLVESLASQAAIALTNRHLIVQLEALFESLINLINLAIDEKSPYTRGHCERVPLLTMMLAEAAERAQTGPLAGFTMSEQERYELKIAGLLHDCGKITTPVHIVDKSTKLQTLHDRIHTIDARFAALRQETEIAHLHRQLRLDPQTDAVTRAGLATAHAACLAQFADDRAFLHRVNIGGETMSDADIARVRTIAAYRWTNADGVEGDFLNADEVENLSIRAGTLTQSERGVINHHIDATIRMLEQLPWPRHLQRVPEYAGGHHERMDGKGYPKGLKRDEMSIPARMIGIADIFEALTASDRPYKLGKTLTESLAILGKFKENGHIDPDLFEVFIRERVYLQYAEKFLDPRQIDVVDENQVPGYDLKNA